MKPIGLTLFVCLLAAAPAFGGTIVEKKGDAALEVTFDGAEPKIALADLITVTLTVEGSATMRNPIVPLDLPASAPWKLEERSKDTRESIGPDRVRWRLVYRFSPREPGAKVSFQFPDVKLRDGTDEEQTVSWKPIAFEVTTQIAEPDQAVPRDITAVETLPPIAPADTAWRWWLAGAAACLLLFTAVAAACILFRRKRLRSPAQLALYEWDRLVALKLPEKGHSERFVTLLTLLVRRFLERQFGLPARSRTTPEFLQNLEQITILTPEQKQFLRAFLERCEAIKFAQQPMPLAECDACARTTREFLNGCQSH